jgi:hypothetical protein
MLPYGNISYAEGNNRHLAHEEEGDGIDKRGELTEAFQTGEMSEEAPVVIHIN